MDQGLRWGAFFLSHLCVNQSLGPASCLPEATPGPGFLRSLLLISFCFCPFHASVRVSPGTRFLSGTCVFCVVQTLRAGCSRALPPAIRSSASLECCCQFSPDFISRRAKRSFTVLNKRLKRTKGESVNSIDFILNYGMIKNDMPYEIGRDFEGKYLLLPM